MYVYFNGSFVSGKWTVNDRKDGSSSLDAPKLHRSAQNSEQPKAFQHNDEVHIFIRLKNANMENHLQKQLQVTSKKKHSGWHTQPRQAVSTLLPNHRFHPAFFCTCESLPVLTGQPPAKASRFAFSAAS
jgi:hypothetical protein